MTAPSPKDAAAIRALVHRIFPSPLRTLHSIQRLKSNLYPTYLIKLQDNTRLVLRLSPEPSTRFLRLENHSLGGDAKVLSLLSDQPDLPIAKLIQYTEYFEPLRSSLLLEDCTSGILYSELLPDMSASEKCRVEDEIDAFTSRIRPYTSATFGFVSKTSPIPRSRTWRQAFVSMAESLLRDAEDMLVLVDYDELRDLLDRSGPALDEVKEARLVLPELADPRNIILDPKTARVNGFVNFENALWGDVALTNALRGVSLASSKDTCSPECSLRYFKVRYLLYQCFKALRDVIIHYYRPGDGPDELQSRKLLTDIIKELEVVQL